MSRVKDGLPGEDVAWEMQISIFGSYRSRVSPIVHVVMCPAAEKTGNFFPVLQNDNPQIS